jgi:hypothetical protein
MVLVVSTLTTRAYGFAERDAGLLLAEALTGTHRVTLGGDISNASSLRSGRWSALPTERSGSR